MQYGYKNESGDQLRHNFLYPNEILNSFVYNKPYNQILKKISIFQLLRGLQDT